MCSQIGNLQNALFESYVEQYNDFLNNLLLKKIIHSVTEETTIHSCKICPEFQVLCFHLFGVKELLEQKLCKD